MEKLRCFHPSQRDLPFLEVFHTDHDGEFFELHFSKLFVEIHALVETAFCPRAADRIAPRSPWLRKYTQAFHHYIDLVAHPDPFSGKWDKILRDKHERSFLIQAIIMKALDTHVLSSLLFGAGPDQVEILRATDINYIDSEGFQRSRLRSDANRLYLQQRHGVPDLFWSKVDKLTTQLVAMLFPAASYVPEVSTWVPPPLQDWHQWLHDLVAYAGWLNVCMRLSPNIFVTNWPSPGSRMEIDQENMSQELFERSDAMAKQFEGIKTTKIKPTEAFHGGWAARVGIAVTPKVTLLSHSEDEIGFAGTETYTVLKPHVVYYQGRFDDGEDAKFYMSQEEYIRRLKALKAEPRGAALAIMLAMALVWFVQYSETGQRLSLWVAEVLGPTTELHPKRWFRWGSNG